MTFTDDHAWWVKTGTCSMQAWSHQMQAVLLAANTRSSSCSGSGIYVQGEVGRTKASWPFFPASL